MHAIVHIDPEHWREGEIDAPGGHENAEDARFLVFLAICVGALACFGLADHDPSGRRWLDALEAAGLALATGATAYALWVLRHPDTRRQGASRGRS